MANSDYTPPIFPCTSRFVARNSIVQARILIQDIQLIISDDRNDAIGPSIGRAVGQIAHELAVAENALNLCGC